MLISPLSQLSVLGDSRSSYWTPPIPTPKDALFYLDGTIILKGSDYYFQDKTSHKRDFLITGYDWAGEYYSSNYSIFPFKTKATISAPVGDATLIAADTGNFFYDTGGTPIQLNPQLFFSNINYENQIFSREVAQTIFPLDYIEPSLQGVELSPQGLVDIVMYSSARTGADIITCNTYYGVPVKLTSNCYWVAKTGNDSTGDGSEGNPYLTIMKAITIVNEVSGKTIYVKKGSYIENSVSGCLQIVWTGNITQVLTIQGLGAVEIKATSGIYGIIKTGDVNHSRTSTINLSNLFINGTSGMTNPMYFLGDYNEHLTVNLTCIYIKAIATNGYTLRSGQSMYAIEPIVNINKCCFKSSVMQYAFIRIINVQNTYLQYATVKAVTDGNYIKYNKFDSQNTGASYLLSLSQPNYVLNSTLNIKYNIFNYANGGAYINMCYQNATLDIKYNVFNAIYAATTSGASLNLIESATPSHATLIIRYNKFNDTQDATMELAYIWVLNLLLTSFDISNNNFVSITKKIRNCISITPVEELTPGSKCNYNYIKAEFLIGVGLCCTEATLCSYFVGVEVIGNYLDGYRDTSPSDDATATVHGILVRGKDCIVKDNYVANKFLGYVLKSIGATNSSFVFENNIAFNCATALTTRAFNNCDLNNNVFAVQTSGYKMIDLYEQTQETLDLSFTNNIFYFPINTQGHKNTIVMRDATFTRVLWYNNIFWVADLTELVLNRDTSVYSSYASMVAASLFVDNQNAINPPFVNLALGQLWLSSKLSYGKDLGSTRKTRLASSTNWLAIDSKGFKLPSIITIDDNDAAPKQCGVYGL